ncbi:MAG: tRNA pseudouridine(38-40) synthase TruA [Bacteroides sp.]|nr:tRNA pseudouridine(38-40) synthase TruA [Bacteroides sp.]
MKEPINLKFVISYNGTAYNGYQSQPGGNTVQDRIEGALSRLLNQRAAINGCSRTDAGVHAREFVFNVRYDRTLSGIDEKGLVTAMNGLLPRDIAVLSCEAVGLEFHARFDAKGKEYLYITDTSPVRNVFTEGLALHYPYKTDIDVMLSAAEQIVGTHDFAAFCKAEAKEHLKTTVRTVKDIRIVRNGSFVEFYVSGEGFLHNMVRIIVGTLIYVNEGKRSIEDVKAAVEGGEREKAGKTLPPCGLYLNKVFY